LQLLKGIASGSRLGSLAMRSLQTFARCAQFAFQSGHTRLGFGQCRLMRRKLAFDAASSFLCSRQQAKIRRIQRRYFLIKLVSPRTQVFEGTLGVTSISFGQTGALLRFALDAAGIADCSGCRLKQFLGSGQPLHFFLMTRSRDGNSRTGIFKQGLPAFVLLSQLLALATPVVFFSNQLSQALFKPNTRLAHV